MPHALCMNTLLAPEPVRSALCSCEASPPSYLDSQLPLVTRADLDLRVRQLVPCALERHVWLALIDADDVQMPMLVPISNAPELPVIGPGGCDLAMDRMLTTLDREFGVASFVFIYERPGGDVLDDADCAWLAALLSRPTGAGYRVRAAYLAHDGGVGGFEAGDLSVVSAGDVVPTVAPGCLGRCRVRSAAVPAAGSA